MNLIASRLRNSLTSRALWGATCVAIVFAISGSALGQTPDPTLEDVRYGKHPKQVMHVWQAESKTPTPLLYFIHGGGWNGGNRMNKHLLNMLPELLDNGITAVSVEYRNIKEAIEDGVEPPLHAPLHDAARGLQFVRAHAKKWNVDPNRVIAGGGSAGACTSLWLAFHDDLADAKSDDRVSQQSTRLMSAAVIGAQTTLDPQQMKEWTPNSKYGSHAFGIFKQGAKNPRQPDFQAFLEKRATILPWINEYSPYALVSKDDPPVYLYYSAKPGIGKPQKDPTHTSNFGVKLQEHLSAKGVKSELVYPSAPKVKHATAAKYILAMFQEPKSAKPAKQQPKRKPNSAMAKIEDTPGLPRVLLIGDSISIGYTVPVRQMLQGKANVHRPLTNCGPTTKGVAELEDWLGEGKWDVIHFNFGLHDLKYMGPKGENLADPSAETSRQQVPPAEYEANLRKIVGRLKKTGAKLIWRNTTPVPEGAKGRVVGHSNEYNEIAKTIMEKHGIAIDDQYAFALKNLKEIQRPANVHFTPEGSKQLAELAVASILEALKK